jgi:hypothetical protein
MELGQTAQGLQAPQTYHAVSCIACGGVTHLVDPVTGGVLVPHPKRWSPNS